MHGGIVFLVILILAVVGGFGGWVLYSRWNAKRLGLPPPSLNPFNRSTGTAPNYPAPAPGGVRGWIDAQVRKFKNRNNRYASGAYEEPSNVGGAGGAARGGRGAGHRLDPDEAWDARVGNETYYEEQELGLHAPPGQQQYGPYSHTGYAAAGGEHDDRGRSRTRDSDEGHLHDGASTRGNPFGDEHAESLRGVSPRPLDHGQDTSYGGAAAVGKAQTQKKARELSPAESRRSMFRENMD